MLLPERKRQTADREGMLGPQVWLAQAGRSGSEFIACYQNILVLSRLSFPNILNFNTIYDGEI